jgi:hypothetical protein
MTKPIRTKKNKVEKTKRTEQMKQPRRCIICAITKDAAGGFIAAVAVLSKAKLAPSTSATMADGDVCRV